jgi:hypothetical protein
MTTDSVCFQRGGSLLSYFTVRKYNEFLQVKLLNISGYCCFHFRDYCGEISQEKFNILKVAEGAFG